MDRKKKLNFMMKQTLAGEVHGLNTLKLIENEVIPRTRSHRLIKELEQQISDEARHIALYKKLLLSDRFYQKSSVHAASEWKSVLGILGEPETPLAVRVAAVYGCLEQLNYYILEDHVLPHLQGDDLRQVLEVVADEEQHLGMIELYEEEIGPYITLEEKHKTLEFIGRFANFLRESVHFPDDSLMSFSKASKKAMGQDLVSLRRRVKGWGSACLD